MLKYIFIFRLLNELGDTFGAILAIHVLFLSITICFYGIAARVSLNKKEIYIFLATSNSIWRYMSEKYVAFLIIY